ncbi:hypothetical protein [Bacillus sp. RAR_GA_16]|uniref:hypothetical protein n=1 Tax=Bacillus sp. RAR_GA_16 TaxID=2876774 RepID=UPI001CCBF85A|nr:hypothetical protein [Bacillus sp. RAR_GA_16]MCA0172137.1 hypothetical protein [Bacillus sp. RAR_GA_16]
MNRNQSDRFQVKDVIHQVKTEELLELVLKLIDTNQEINQEVITYLDQKGYIKNDDHKKLTLDDFNEKFTEVIHILEDINSFGGGLREEEDLIFENMMTVLDLFRKEAIPHSYREECIEALMKQYLVGNSGFEDAIRDWVWDIAQDSRDWEIIIAYLKQSSSDYDKQVIMGIYRDILGDETVYEQMRMEHLEYGSDYYDYVQFLHKKGHQVKAVEVAKKGIEIGKGRRSELFDYLFTLYHEANNKKLALDTLCDKFISDPSFSLYQEILRYVDTEEQERIKKELYESIVPSRHSEVKAEIDLHEGNAKGVWDYVMSRSYNNYSLSNVNQYEAYLIKQYPQEMVDYFSQRVSYCIGMKSRKYYKIAAKNAVQIREIYESILLKPQLWDQYVKSILSQFANRPALYDEFDGIR